MGDIEKKVKAVIAYQLGKKADELVNTQSFMKDLGADSLDLVSLLVALEDALDVEISDEMASKIKTVQDAIDFAQKTLASKV